MLLLKRYVMTLTRQAFFSVESLLQRQNDSFPIIYFIVALGQTNDERR